MKTIPQKPPARETRSIDPATAAAAAAFSPATPAADSPRLPAQAQDSIPSDAKIGASEIAVIFTAPAQNVFTRIGERQQTENKSTCFPNNELKARLRNFKYQHRIAEAFVLEDALAFYFTALSDPEIIARLKANKKAGMRRPSAFVPAEEAGN